MAANAASLFSKPKPRSGNDKAPRANRRSRLITATTNLDCEAQCETGCDTPSMTDGNRRDCYERGTLIERSQMAQYRHHLSRRNNNPYSARANFLAEFCRSGCGLDKLYAPESRSKNPAPDCRPCLKYLFGHSKDSPEPHPSARAAATAPASRPTVWPLDFLCPPSACSRSSPTAQDNRPSQ
jgi:hypothetical protein